MSHSAAYVQGVIDGIEQTTTFVEIKKQVVAMLKEYKKLPGLIAAMEAKAEGAGINIPAEIDEERFEHLATVGRAYSTGLTRRDGQLHSTGQLTIAGTPRKVTVQSIDGITRSQAEDLFYKAKADNDEDRQALDEIVGVMIGLTPRGRTGELDPSGQYVTTHEKAAQLAKQEVERLKRKKVQIEQAMTHLKSYAPHLEKLLRMRYFEKEKITAVCNVLNIEARTQDNWHREAISEIAPLLGIGLGW